MKSGNTSILCQTETYHKTNKSGKPNYLGDTTLTGQTITGLGSLFTQKPN